VIVSSFPTVSVRFRPTLVVSSFPIDFVRSWPTVCDSSASTSMSWFFSAWIFRSSDPFLSSNMISLKFAGPAPFELRDLTPLLVLFPGRSYGGIMSAL